jgi:hypothetical protein
MRPLVVLCLFAVLAVGHPGRPPRASEPGPGIRARLTTEDRQYLDGLFRDFLFDPKEAFRVRVELPAPDSPWYREYPPPLQTADGWLAPGPAGRPPRVYFTDGCSVPVPSANRLRFISFVAACRQRYAPGAYHSSFASIEDSHLARAAWLYRLGHETLAARALAAARENHDDPREELRKQLAQRAFDDLHDAYCRRDDLEALGHGGRLFRLYPDHVEKIGHSTSIMTELVRRWWGGTFGRAPPDGWPPWFAFWNPERKIAALIAALDQVDEASGHTNYHDWGEDRRHRALVALGERAIPALFDTIENDRRLTRRPERFRGDASGRIISVREMADAAVGAILRVRHFDPTGKVPGREHSHRLAQMRLYWETYGQLPFDERMMRILTDPQTSSAARKEAAGNLAWLNADRTNGWDRGPVVSAPRRPHAALAKFRKPTVAEAILAGLDRDLKGPAGSAEQIAQSDRDRIEEQYLAFLVQLGDPSIAWELAGRAGKFQDPNRRRRYALAAHRLGVSGPWLALARDLERGTRLVALRPDGSPDPDEGELDVIRLAFDLIADPVGPEAGRALCALADPEHPRHRAAVDYILGRDSFWNSHDSCLALLRRALDDDTPTGRHFYLRGDEIETQVGNQSGDRARLPPDRPNPEDWAEHVEERTRDVAARRVRELVAGVPDYHPLHKDAPSALTAMKNLVDRHRNGFRRLRGPEIARLGFKVGEWAYVPDVRPMGRPAAAADVAAGRAVFHLDGEGRLIDQALPAWVVLKAGTKADPRQGLAVQAEMGPDGKVRYGVILRDAIRTVRADEIERVEQK